MPWLGATRILAEWRECVTITSGPRDVDIRLRPPIEGLCILTVSAGARFATCGFRCAGRLLQRLGTLCNSMVSVSSRSACSPSGCGRWTADAARNGVSVRFERKSGSNDDVHARVDIRPPKRLAALCISTVSIGARSGDEPLPAWIARRRYPSKRAFAIHRGAPVHVDIQPTQTLEALWFSTVRVRGWSRGNADPDVDNCHRSQSKPRVFER